MSWEPAQGGGRLQDTTTYTFAMVMSARRCAGCGGPLPQTPVETRQITCSFCGIVNDVAHGGAPQPLVVNVDIGNVGKVASSVGRTITWIVLLSVAAVLIGVGVVVYVALRPAKYVIQTSTNQTTKIASRQQPIEPRELETAGESGWRELKAAPPASDWNAFDPVANLEWASMLAHGWAADARLTRIDLTRVSAAGTLDLSTGADDVAGYRFVSPARIEEWNRIADREPSARVGYELMIKAAQKKVTAYLNRGRPSSRDLPPLKVDALRLGDAIAAAKRGRGFVEYPFYNGYLIYLEREGWVWYLQSLSQREGLPRVRARDGAVFPYKR